MLCARLPLIVSSQRKSGVVVGRAPPFGFRHSEKTLELHSDRIASKSIRADDKTIDIFQYRVQLCRQEYDSYDF